MAAGCSGTESQPTDEGTLQPGQQAFGEYILHVQPKTRKMTLTRLSHAALALESSRANAQGPRLSPQAMFDANLQSDDTSGSGPADSVELVTDDASWEDTFGTAASSTCPANAICADVTLNSFWSKTLNFTYAQITSIVDSNGDPVGAHAALNSDAPSNTGLDASLGLWLYQSAAIDATHGSINSTASAPGAQGVMLPGAANGAKKKWKLANPDDADVYYRLRVVAATSYTNYNIAKLTYRTTPTYIDGCSLGTGETGLPIKQSSNNTTLATSPTLASSVAQLYVALPFQFTFYGTTYSSSNGRVNFSKFGNVTLSNGVASGGEIPSLANNVALPSTSAPRASFSPWWDNTVIAANGGMCAKLVGSSPNRQLVLSWKRMALSGNGNGGPFVTFSAVLNESTDEIWFNYGTLNGSAGGWSATYGAQNAAGNLAAIGSVGSASTFPNGTPGRLVLQPIP
ncbi:bacillopeptidase F [Minicystis rosea]|nr:bacillopeptidase F [Minicystis rosea]